MNALEKLNAYENRDKEEGMTRRTEPLVKLTYKELDGLMYPEINEPKNNHTYR